MTTKTKTFCPNCEAEIKSTLISDNILVSELRTEFINAFANGTSSNYCSKCSKDLLDESITQYKKLSNDKFIIKSANSRKLEELIQYVPIITLHTPQDWKYNSLEIVSAQSVTGTGVFAEITSNWTDFFGMESGKYNQKLKSGEDKCKSILRLQALQQGGNAVLGTDIDYSEAGAGKGMLMVCMAGTAVKITNLNELNYNIEALEEIENIMAEVNDAELEIEKLSKYKFLVSSQY